MELVLEGLIDGRTVDSANSAVNKLESNIATMLHLKEALREIKTFHTPLLLRQCLSIRAKVLGVDSAELLALIGGEASNTPLTRNVLETLCTRL